MRSLETSTLSSAIWRAQPGQQGHEAEPLVGGDLVQRLADVPQVGEQPLAVHAGQHPGGQPGGDGGLEHSGHAAGGEQAGPVARRAGDPVGQVVPAGVQLDGGLPEEAR